MLSELQPLATSPLGYGFAVVLGLVWGSFANVCIYRWPPSEAHPRGRSVVAPGSHCSACQTPIRWYDNVPILSYLWLRGQCRSCKAAFSPRYLFVEASTAALFGVAWWFTVGPGGMLDPFAVGLERFAIDAGFVFVMVVITFIDLDHKLILDKVTFPAIPVFYALSFLIPGRLWWEGLVGAAVGYGIVWSIGAVYFAITKREGLGLGDGKLLAVVGALLGWRGVVVSLFGGSLVGSVIGTLAIVSARQRARRAGSARGAESPTSPPLMKVELPFGPFLALAALFYLFAEPWVQLNFRLPSG